MSDRALVQKFLSRIRTDNLADVGVGEFIDADHLLNHPDFQNRRHLIDAIAARIATNERELTDIRALAARHFGTEWFHTEASPNMDAPQRERKQSVWNRLAKGFANLPWVVHALLILAMFFAVSLLIVDPKRPEKVSPPSTVPTPPEALESSNKWIKEELPSIDLVYEKVVKSEPRSLSETDYRALVFGVISITLGFTWISLPGFLRRHRRREVEALRKSSRTKRRDLSRQALAENASRRLIYEVPETTPMADSAASDSATILGRLFGEVDTSKIDTDRTIQATALAGGRIVPVTATQRIARSVVILVDVESGSHPWLGSIDWLLSRWAALGVRYKRYDYRFEPTWLTDTKTGFATSFERISHRADGEPLLIISRRLTSQGMTGEAAWLRHISAWPTHAWLDPSPSPPESLPSGYVTDVKYLELKGFKRFPMSIAGLISLANHLVSNGEGRPPSDWPAPQSLDDPKVREAARVWALFAALVPDPTWEQLRAARLALPEVRRVMTRDCDLQTLIEWVEQRIHDNAVSRDGTTLDLPQSFIDDLILEQRKIECEDDSKEVPLERRAREMLLAQLDGSAPKNVFMHQFWQLTRMRHELAVDPDRAMQLVGPLVGSAWHEEALEAISHELRRETQTRRMSRSIRAGLGSIVDPERSGIRLFHLIFPPRPMAFAGLLLCTVLAGVGWAALHFRSPVQDAILTTKVNVQDVIPLDYRLSVEEADGNNPFNGVRLDEWRLLGQGRGESGSLAIIEYADYTWIAFGENDDYVRLIMIDERGGDVLFISNLGPSGRSEVFNLRTLDQRLNALSGAEIYITQSYRSFLSSTNTQSYQYNAEFFDFIKSKSYVVEYDNELIYLKFPWTDDVFSIWHSTSGFYEICEGFESPTHRGDCVAVFSTEELASVIRTRSAIPDNSE